MSLTVQDRLDLMELVSRYNFAIDHYDVEGWVDVFTDDGELIAGGTSLAKGRDGLFAYLDARRRRGEPKVRHWVTNFVLDGDSKRARLRLYVMAFDVLTGLGAPQIMGEYDDEAVKIDGHWKFAVRRIEIVAGGMIGPHRVVRFDC